ncbi:MAG: hypothetical protein HYS27_14245 [Deltaproteobacteria bacterium]|nr:hypothetical protein [Deltaproteobacteria bacterium]
MRTEPKLIAAGKVLDALGKDAKVTSVSVDGATVDVDLARAAFAAASAPQPAAEASGVAGQLLDKLDANLDKLEEKLRSTGLGNKIADFVRADPEKVAGTVTVDVALANGEHLRIPVVVVDTRATAFLQRLSMYTEAAALVPVVGQLASGATSLASAIASVVAFALGEREIGRSLLRTAGKQVVMVGVGFIPVISSATSALAVVIDRADARRARTASVADVVNLGAPIAAGGV